MSIRLVATKPAAYGPAWHARWHRGDHRGARCCYCARDIAVSAESRAATAACIYCGLDRGDLPAVEIFPAEKGEA